MHVFHQLQFLHLNYSTNYLVIIGLLITMIIALALLVIKKKRARLQDIEAIAGEDIMVTQLDLARAYIEMDNKTFAKEILNEVIRKGNLKQKQEARQLITEIS